MVKTVKSGKIVKKNLTIQKLKTSIGGKPILKGVDLVIRPGKIVTLMGTNGSGKSTLAQVLMGNPEYQVDSGKVTWQGKNILKLTPGDRAKMGLFMSFQYPHELPGVNMHEFLSTSYKSIFGEKSHQAKFDTELKQAMKDLKLSSKYLDRSVNDGFSGGEKKKSEILQLKLLKPKMAILDETDSGLDIDALKLIAKNITKMRAANRGFLVITHYQRLLNFIKPDYVHVMMDGKIVKSGGPELAKTLEKKGYNWLKK